MRLLPRWLPQSGWKRYLVLTLIGGFLCVVVLVTAAYFLFKIPQVQMWVFTKFMTRDLDNISEMPPPPHLKPEETALLTTDSNLLTSAAGLYRITNVWPVHLHFTSAEWAGLTPQRVPPMPGFMQPDGSMNLRNPKASRSGLAGVLGIDLPWSRGTVEFPGHRFTNAGVRFKGNGTFLAGMKSYKRPYKIALDRHEKELRLAGRSTLNFGNLLADNSFLSDALGYEFFREAGVPAPRTAFARLLLSIQGRFDPRILGVYIMVENPDAAWAKEQFGIKGVTLFKPVTPDLFLDLGADWKEYHDIYDPKTPIDDAAKQRVIEFAKLLTHANDADFAAKAGEFIHIDAFARFFACEVLLANYDGMLSTGQNFLFYLDPRTRQFGFIPWDLDQAWGEFPLIGTAESRERADIWHPWAGRNRFLERMMQVEPVREAYRRELKRLLDTQFVPDRLSRRLDELAGVVRPFVAEESTNRVAKFERAIAGQWGDGPRDGNPFDENRPAFPLKRYFAARAKSVRGQLDGVEKGVPPTRQQ